MNIAILGTRGIPSGYSGYEVFAEELGTRLVKRGHKVTVYAHANRFTKRPTEYRGVRIRYVPSLKGKNTSQLSHSLLASLHVVFSDADVVLFCNVANGPFGLLFKLFRKKSAINVDGLEWLRPKWSKLARVYFRLAARMATTLFDVIVTDAKGMQQIYREKFNCDSVDIAYGADLKFSERPSLIHPFGLKPQGYYLIASRLVPDNNADLIAKAFFRSNVKRTLAIAGGTPYKNSFEEEIRKQCDYRVMFLGHIDDAEVINELHCNAYAYLHGHEFGGTNPALLKALACGNCVLALDTVFNREVLDDGEFGLLFPKDVDSLAELIAKIDANPELRNRYSEKSRQRILQRYSWDGITDQYEALFLQTIS